jgi:hypothetical protein
VAVDVGVGVAVVVCFVDAKVVAKGTLHKSLSQQSMARDLESNSLFTPLSQNCKNENGRTT